MAELIGQISTQSEGMIHDTQYDYYGKRFAVCSSDGTIEVYDIVQDGSKTKTGFIKAHNGPVWQISWAHPKFGSVLASSSFDKKVTIWKEVKHGDWQEVISFSDHQASVNSVSFAPWECGLKLATGSSDGKISILTRKPDNQWEKPQLFQAHSLGVNSISWAPFINNEDFGLESNQQNEEQVVALRLATASSDCTVKIWEQDFRSNDFIQVAELKGHKNWVRDVAWCPKIGNNQDVIASCSDNGLVIIWTSVDGVNFEQRELNQFEGAVWRLSWSVTGNLLAVSCLNRENGNNVYVYKENEESNWELVSKILDQKTNQ